ncbi:FeS-binding protein, partial [Erysipelatoclostridium ramosum]|nr:FeS-binding protein [Thomasclavelia ramosa]
GILPTALKQAVRISGNTALKGCCRYALEQNRTRMELLCKKGHCILLASDTGFSDAFISHMLLEPYT